MKNLLLACCWLLLIALQARAQSPDTLVAKKLLKDQIEVLIPKSFTPVSDSMLAKRYPSGNKPQAVWANDDATINISFSIAKDSMTPERIDAARQALLAAFQSNFHDAVVYGSGVKKINGKDFGYLELNTPAMGERIFNLFFFTDYKGQMLLCSFNCVERFEEAWRPTATKIMDSMKVKP